MGRKLKSRFDLLKPNIATRVELKQQQQKCNHDSRAVARREMKCMHEILGKENPGCLVNL